MKTIYSLKKEILISLLVAFLLFFAVPSFYRTPYVILFKLFGLVLGIFAIIFPIVISYCEKLAIKSLKKHSGASQIIEDSNGELIQVFEEERKKFCGKI